MRKKSKKSTIRKITWRKLTVLEKSIINPRFRKLQFLKKKKKPNNSGSPREQIPKQIYGTDSPGEKETYKIKHTDLEKNL